MTSPALLSPERRFTCVIKLQSRLLMVTGKVQKEGEVIHVIVQECHNLTELLTDLNVEESRLSSSVQTLLKADEKEDTVDSRVKKKTESKKVVQAEIFPAGRNFK